MPELPEVETTLRGITPHMQHQTIKQIIVRESRLRWPIPSDLNHHLCLQTIQTIQRRGKYLLIGFNHGTLILHLGMSGRLRIVPATTLVEKHDHVDLVMQNNLCCRFTDPRRFGCLLWTDDAPEQHKLLRNLGPEPLSKIFTANYLHQLSRHRKINIKQFIMNSQIVVGVGNIYANEALFAAKIHPSLSANKISLARYQLLIDAIKKILKAAIKCGGTTLRDFLASDGKPGYFTQSLSVYGRAGLDCLSCGNLLKTKMISQRATVYCSHCQH